MNYESTQYIMQQIFDILEAHFGHDVEFILHDLTRNYEHSVVDVRNGHITNRKIGDSGDILGLQVVRGSEKDGNCFNYINITPDGKTLRSSTEFIRNEDGKAIMGFGINEDITKAVELEHYLKEKNNLNSAVESNKDFYYNDVNKMLEKIIEDAQVEIGRPADVMDKDEKMLFIKYLDERGAFLITKSGAKVCKLLGISKYTLYKYLDITREE